jgi:hypothetical protein
MIVKVGFFISLFVGNTLYGQSVDSIVLDLSCLSPSSVTIALTYVPSLLLDECSQNLVDLKNDSIEHNLIGAMQDSKMVLPVHVILTRRHHISSSVSESFQYKNDSLTGFVFTYNKLEWFKNASTGEIRISEKSIRKCQMYWRKKIFKTKK